MLIRYALLVALAASSVWCLILVSKSSGSEMLLAVLDRQDDAHDCPGAR